MIACIKLRHQKVMNHQIPQSRESKKIIKKEDYKIFWSG